MSQASLRRQLRKARRTLSRRYRRHAAQSLRHILATNLRFRRARRVAFYMAAGGELDPAPLMNDAAVDGKQCHLPIMIDRLMRWRPAPLAFQRFDPLYQLLVKNRYGILEPPLHAPDITKTEQLDIILVPLVAFDRRGNRVGMGQGFYDRTLGLLQARYRKPWLVGCAYSVQETEHISANPWDVPLDAVVTEKGLFEVARR
ncbi:MAG: 5-formyltetrahydrofolate cyclo-ligase [Gammaproteobacteria bacterium]|nr:5-formyltetrahydrofolate cyclo-ligase [Gammaproteobacteria bacterium]